MAAISILLPTTERLPGKPGSVHVWFVARILREAIQFYQRLIPAPRCNGCWTMPNSGVQSHAKVTQMTEWTFWVARL